MLTRLTLVAAFSLFSASALAGEYDSNMQEGNPAADNAGQLVAPGLAHGGSAQERGDYNYQVHRDEQLNTIQQNQGDGAMLHQEQIDRRNYHPN